MKDWQDISTAPKDGTPIWAYLYDAGIRLVRWGAAEEWAAEHGGEPDEYISCFVEVGIKEEAWAVRYWLPANAIPAPPETGQ